MNRNYVEKLTDNSSKQSCPKFSHNSSMLVYSADNNLWLVKFDFGTESQITEDGKLIPSSMELLTGYMKKSLELQIL